MDLVQLLQQLELPVYYQCSSAIQEGKYMPAGTPALQDKKLRGGKTCPEASKASKHQ
jgi:hypothetical protein